MVMRAAILPQDRRYSLFHNIYNHFKLHCFCDNYVYYRRWHDIEIQWDFECKKQGVFSAVWVSKFKFSLAAARHVRKKLIIIITLLYYFMHHLSKIYAHIK